MVLDVGALQMQWPALPEAASPIKHIVVADVSPSAVVDVNTADLLNPISRGTVIKTVERLPALMVHGDLPDAVHRLDLASDRALVGPLRPGEGGKGIGCHLRYW